MNLKSNFNLKEIWDKNIWQAYTQMKLTPFPPVIEKAKGVYLYDKDKNKIIDAIGSWWVNIHGHNHPYINKKLIKQIKTLDHTIYAGLIHTPALELSKKLSELTQNKLPRTFFSDNGSTAVEIALKMSYQYFKNKGINKNEFVSLGGGYHGDTIGAMSVGARNIFHNTFKDLLFKCHYLPKPEFPFICFDDEEYVDLKVKKVIIEFQKIIKKSKNKVCALILEPLLQAASSGFNLYPKKLLEELYIICKNENIFLILDEVFTGNGRLGTYFAFQKTKVEPDFIALSKGLSNGYLPFAVTLTTNEIFDAFYSNNRNLTFFHGHSMTANPLGCSVALASLELFEKEKTLAKVKQIESWHKLFLNNLLLEKKYSKKIKEIRYCGSVGIIELKTNDKYTSEFSWNFMKKALIKKVLLRPLGNVIYLTPPYCINYSELKKVYEVISSLI